MVREVHAFRNHAQNLEKATSGGAFMAFAEAFFHMHGGKQTHVYGVILDKELNVCYDVADTLEDCEKFCGSKYVRSGATGVFEHVRDDLCRGCAVLFTGTPCRVAALQKYLSKNDIDQSDLFCIDLICHGTPQPIYWKAYRKWLEQKYKSVLVDFKFRTHGKGASGYTCTATFENGKSYVNIPETQIFNRMFLRHYLFSEGCFKCPFANLDRKGDVTIGDFWGVETVMPDYPYAKDVSEILVNTLKGQQMMNYLNDVAPVKDYCLKQCYSEDYVKYQNNLQRPASKPDDYEQFRKDFIDKGISFVAAKYVRYDMLHRVKYFLFRK